MGSQGSCRQQNSGKYQTCAQELNQLGNFTCDLDSELFDSHAGSDLMDVLGLVPGVHNPKPFNALGKKSVLLSSPIFID